jgi:signal transduction histidine kinase
MKFIIVSVDTGMGIPARDQEKIFDRFYKSGSPDSVSIKGTGLGLPIAKKIVEMHGGKIWAAKIKKGSRFVFTLPEKIDNLYY